MLVSISEAVSAYINSIIKFYMCSIFLYLNSTHNNLDINECDLDSCGINANCINTIGSFECQCLSGFRGDGRICTGLTLHAVDTRSMFFVDINECTENLDDCDSDESCLNTIGSFQCSRCPIGFQSDGQLCIGVIHLYIRVIHTCYIEPYTVHFSRYQ